MLLHLAAGWRHKGAMIVTKHCSAPDKDAPRTLSSMSRRFTAIIAFAACTSLGSPALAQLPVGRAPMPAPAPTTPVTTPVPPPVTSPFPAYAAASTSAVIDGVAQWNMLRQSDRYSFADYAGFLVRHPGWPGEAALRANAERQLAPNTASPTLVIAFFQRYAPLTAAAALRYAEALDSMGQRDAARDWARRAWTMGALTPDDESRLNTRFPGLLGPADQDARMEKLLWSRSTTTAQRQLPLTSPVRQPVFSARLAMQLRSTDAASKASYTADRVHDDAGYIMDRAAWLRASGQEYVARTLFAQPRRLSAPPLDPERWLDTMVAYAKSANDSGQFQTAYDIARQLDDAYPAGTVVRDRPLPERDDYTTLSFLAGTLALKRLGRPAEAIALFDRYASAAKTAQTQSKGYYWAGRAAEAAGRRADAETYYRRTADYFDQFYGQLAAERLNLPISVAPQLRTIEVSAAARSAFMDREVVRAAQLLGQRGDWTNQSLFLRAIAAGANSDTDNALAIELAQRLGRPDLGVMIGRNVPVAMRHTYLPSSFPTIPVSQDSINSWTMIHAISRQESQFDRKIVSRAGARGLMQLMPGTARDSANAMGVPYASYNLDDATYNSELGAWYFGTLMDRYGGSYVLAVAAYNAGPGNVNKWLAAYGDPRSPGTDVLSWIENIPFKETRDYVQRVLENAVIYDQLNPRGRHDIRAPLSAFLGKSNPG